MGTATRGLARAYAVGLTGISGEVVEVEAHLAAGTPAFAVTGLPDTAVREARDRIKAAIVNSRVEWPNRRITVGLSPASMPKHGTGYDLAMAVSLLAAAGQLPADPLASYLLVGELGLDGRIRSLPGVLPMVHTAARAGLRTVMVPAVHAAEAALVPEVRVYGVGTLAEAIALLRGEATVEPFVRPPAGADPAGDPPDRHVDGLDLADVVGQEIGRRALEVAAAGGHHLFLVGPPGAGKTLLAERLPGLLPPLDEVPLTAQPRSPRSPAHRAAPLTAVLPTAALATAALPPSAGHRSAGHRSAGHRSPGHGGLGDRGFGRRGLGRRGWSGQPGWSGHWRGRQSEAASTQMLRAASHGWPARRTHSRCHVELGGGASVTGTSSGLGTIYGRRGLGAATAGRFRTLGQCRQAFPAAVAARWRYATLALSPSARLSAHVGRPAHP